MSFGDVVSPVALAVFAGFAFGKPVGVVTFSWLAVCSGIALQAADLSWKLLAGGALLAGVGFTMALFIAHLAFSKDLIDAAKLGTLSGSVVSAVAGVALLAWLSPRPSDCLPSGDGLVDDE